MAGAAKVSVLRPLLLCCSVFLVFLAALPGIGAAQEIVSVTPSGTCQDFTVTVLASGLSASSGECWDVKLSVPGQVESLDVGDEGEWQSTFYYLPKAICTPAYSAVVHLDLDSREGLVRGTAMLRQSSGSKVVEKDFEIVQSCPPAPEPLPDFLFLVLCFGIVVFFGWGIVWWWRNGGAMDGDGGNAGGARPPVKGHASGKAGKAAAKKSA